MHEAIVTTGIHQKDRGTISSHFFSRGGWCSVQLSRPKPTPGPRGKNADHLGDLGSPRNPRCSTQEPVPGVNSTPPEESNLPIAEPVPLSPFAAPLPQHGREALTKKNTAVGVTAV